MQRIIIRKEGVDRGVGIAAPSSPIDPSLLKRSYARFARWGLPVQVDDSVVASFRYLAGKDSVRAEAFQRLATDPNVGLIWCARGGYGTTRILPLLEKLGTVEALRRDPKLLVGYSDITA